MGPWASAIVAVASLAGVFFAVMGFRGLVESVERFSGHCLECGKATMLPLPPRSQRCFRCHYALLSLPHAGGRRTQVR